MIERLSVAVLRTMVNAPPAMAELATSLITDGVAGRIVEWKRKEIAARQEIAGRVLPGLSIQTHPQSPHIWVRLPEPWQTDAFVTRARHRGILLDRRRVVCRRSRNRCAGHPDCARTALPRARRSKRD